VQPDLSKFINSAQVAGIESYTLNDGPGRGVRALCVNTGAGLRYRVLVDRGLDIDQAFFHQHSLAFLTHAGAARPSRAIDHGLEWLKNFPGGLLISCGPFNIGPPTTDDGEELGLHGPHSNTAATVESIRQPDPHRDANEISITGVLRYGPLYGPTVELRRTITSRLGESAIDFVDEFYNPGNTDVPHAWLLHINFGYPLLDQGAEFCVDATKVEPRADVPGSTEVFRDTKHFKRIPGPIEKHRGKGSVVGYLYPRPDRAGRATVGIANPKLGIAVAIHYSTKEFPRCGNWQHYGQREYVAALEPMNGTVDGRDKDRARGLLDSLKAGQTKTYRYSIEVLADKSEIQKLLKLNK